MSNKYNGWSNYPTWRVMTDIINYIEFEEYVTSEDIKEIVEDTVLSNVEDLRALCFDYAKAFISQVNFFEIAESINSEVDEQNKYEQ
jgi:hypothetical protein